jgi:hypothetical protein
MTVTPLAYNAKVAALRRCVNHSFIASVQASQWGGVAYSPAIRPRPLGPRQGGAFRVAGRRRRWASQAVALCDAPHTTAVSPQDELETRWWAQDGGWGS